MNKEIQIYTDGSSLGNPGPGGWGTVIVDGGKIIEELGGYHKDTTNNRMELQAAIEALKYMNKHHHEYTVTIHADSAYVLGGVTNWIFGWEKNGWRTSKKEPVLNQDLWQELIGLVREFKGKIIWQKVKGHSGHIYNDRADEIATLSALHQKYIL
ncbi:MAG: ribonuclease HI [Candidatus Nomurabacteria bacterium]